MNYDILKELIKDSYDSETVNDVCKEFKRKTSFRINTAKCTREEIESVLNNANILYENIPWYKDAYYINEGIESLVKLDIYKEGKIYIQSLSSMIPPIILNPLPNENILDMTAAPGGKTTELYNLSNGKSLITAVEKDKIRFSRLKYNIELQGASRINLINDSSLNLSDYLKFDKILLDAPCSGSGVLDNNSKFSMQLVENSAKLQHKLLYKALKMIPVGGTIIYSTCSIIKRENEDNLINLINNGTIEVVPIDIDIDEKYKLNVTIKGTLCLKPCDIYEGFFVAKLKKLKDY